MLAKRETRQGAIQPSSKGKAALVVAAAHGSKTAAAGRGKKKYPRSIALKQFYAKAQDASAAGKRPTAGRLAVSFERSLEKQVRDAAAKEAAGNVSAWLADAARERLRLDAGRQLVTEYEVRHGKISQEALAEVERQWPR